jgi:hypothetical protein
MLTGVFNLHFPAVKLKYMRIILTCFLLQALTLNAQELSYYLPKEVQYNQSIPTPEKIIGHHVGEWHVTHDKLSH